MTKVHYTCHGEVRGDCGERHRTIEAAARCCLRDRAGCNRQGCYRDRFPEARDQEGRAVALGPWDRETANEIIG